MQPLLPLVFASVLSQAFGSLSHSGIPLNRYAMVMAHDSASGYLTTWRPIKGEVYDWTITQGAGPSAQLDCGARAFDWRPSMSGGALQAHHGSVEIPHSFADSLSEMRAWASAHPSELVLINIWDCTSDGSGDCDAAVASALVDAGVPTVTECDLLKGKTVGDAMDMAKRLDGGAGSLLAIHGSAASEEGCSDSNYDESVFCWGSLFGEIEGGSLEERRAADAEGLFTYSCWDDGTKAWNVMDDYLTKTTNAGPSGTAAPLWQVQALWQEAASSVAIAELHLSSILIDEQKSAVNAKLAKRITAGDFLNLNLVEVNNVCDGGAELLAAVTTFNDKTAATLRR